MGVLRLRDGRTGSYVELAARPSTPLRLCVHGPSIVARWGAADMRVLLVADVLTRIAELGGLQVIAVLTAATPPPEALERDAVALGISPPVIVGGSGEAEAVLGRPADIHVTGSTAGLVDPGDGLLINVDPVDDLAREAGGEAVNQETSAGGPSDALALRLALLSRAYRQSAELTRVTLAEAGEVLSRWRHGVAEWACEPSRPVPAETAREIAAAFHDDLNTTAALAVLHRLEPDPGVPSGAKFETFAFADRVLGLDLVNEIGHLR
jgi:hypothetical protein